MYYSYNVTMRCVRITIVNRLTPNDPYMGRTAPLTSKRCILYIYLTNISTEYFKHALYSPFFSLQNAVCFIMLTCLVPVLFTFYIQGVLNLKKNNSGAKGLMWKSSKCHIFWVCVCTRSCPAYKAHAPYYIVICSPSCCTMFCRNMSQTALFSGGGRGGTY